MSNRVTELSEARRAAQDKLDGIKAKLAAIHNDAGSRSLTAGEQARWDRLTAEAEAAKADFEAADADYKAEALRAAAANPRAREAGWDNSYARGPQVMRRVDPYGDSSASIEDRAAAAVELNPHASDEARHAAASLLDQREHPDRSAIAEHVWLTSDPNYVSAFMRYVKDPADGRRDFTAAEMDAWRRVKDYNYSARAAMSLTGANGGVLVPQHLDPTVVLTNDSTNNDVRKIAKIERTMVDQLDLVTSAGVNASWLAEGTEASDNSPTFTQPQITTHKAAAWLFGSYEVLADSGFDEVGRLIADAFDRLEAEAFINGTGSGQPYGLITRLSGTGPVVVGSSGAEDAATLTAADVFAMDNALGARWRRNASWLAPKVTYNTIRQLGTDSNGSSTFWADFGPGVPSTLIGYPTYTADEMDQTTVSGSSDYVLALGAFSEYRIVDRIGTQLVYNPMVVGASQYPTGQAGWFAYKRVGADVTTSSAFAVLKL